VTFEEAVSIPGPVGSFTGPPVIKPTDIKPPATNLPCGITDPAYKTLLTFPKNSCRILYMTEFSTHHTTLKE
jgi:hypothetical protein